MVDLIRWMLMLDQQKKRRKNRGIWGRVQELE
jgi:hypothetical protein